MPEAKKPDDEITKFASDLELMRHRAIQLRLYATGQRLEGAIRMVGFEVNGNPDGCSRYEAAQAVRRDLPFVVPPPGQVQHPCPDCGATNLEMRAYGGSWDDADFHCAQCGKLIQRAWSAL